MLNNKERLEDLETGLGLMQDSLGTVQEEM